MMMTKPSAVRRRSASSPVTDGSRTTAPLDCSERGAGDVHCLAASVLWQRRRSREAEGTRLSWRCARASAQRRQRWPGCEGIRPGTGCCCVRHIEGTKRHMETRLWKKRKRGPWRVRRPDTVDTTCVNTVKCAGPSMYPRTRGESSSREAQNCRRWLRTRYSTWQMQQRKDDVRDYDVAVYCGASICCLVRERERERGGGGEREREREREGRERERERGERERDSDIVPLEYPWSDWQEHSLDGYVGLVMRLVVVT